MDREKKYDSMYHVNGIELSKHYQHQYRDIDELIERLKDFKESGATHYEISDDDNECPVWYFMLNPIKQRDETDEELQRRIDYEERKKNAKQLEAENTRIKELKQLRFLKAKYPEEK